jgi:hypothetical protein
LKSQRTWLNDETAERVPPLREEHLVVRKEVTLETRPHLPPGKIDQHRTTSGVTLTLGLVVDSQIGLSIEGTTMRTQMGLQRPEKDPIIIEGDQQIEEGPKHPGTIVLRHEVPQSCLTKNERNV